MGKEKLQKTYELCNDYMCEKPEVTREQVLRSIAYNLTNNNEMQLMGANASVILNDIADGTASETDCSLNEADELIEDVCGYLGELLAE